MSNSDLPRLVDRESDVLYRKVHPDFWDQSTNKLKPAAFQDPGKPYSGLSFFIKRFKTPAKVCEFFAGMSEVKNVVGKSVRPIFPADMFDHGFRIVAIPANVINEIERLTGDKLLFEAPSPHEIDPNGHISIRGGHKYALFFLRHARLIEKEETCALVLPG